MIHEIFKKIQDYRGIKTNRLAEKVGMNRVQLSQFRSGKANVSIPVLWNLLIAMEEMSPGARRDFGRAIGGEEIDLTELSDEEICRKIMELGKAWQTKKDRKKLARV